MSKVNFELKQIQKKISDELDSCIKFWTDYSHDEEQGQVVKNNDRGKYLTYVPDAGASLTVQQLMEVFMTPLNTVGFKEGEIISSSIKIN